MSTVRESNPWWAITSAEKLAGIDSHPLTTASPRAHFALIVFSRTGGVSSREWRSLRDPADVDRHRTETDPRDPHVGEPHVLHQPRELPRRDEAVHGPRQVGVGLPGPAHERAEDGHHVMEVEPEGLAPARERGLGDLEGRHGPA